MPYIKEKAREKFNLLIEVMDNRKIENTGDLRFIILSMVNWFLGYDSFNYNAKFMVIPETLYNIFRESRGELNYLITKACKSYMDYKGEKYDHYDDAINVIENIKLDLNPSARDLIAGTLECVKMELYARKTRPYEILKCEENGDVW